MYIKPKLLVANTPPSGEIVSHNCGEAMFVNDVLVIWASLRTSEFVLKISRLQVHVDGSKILSLNDGRF